MGFFSLTEFGWNKKTSMFFILSTHLIISLWILIKDIEIIIPDKNTTWLYRKKPVEAYFLSLKLKLC